MAVPTYEVGDKVRKAGWRKKDFVTLLERIETPSGDKGWRGWHSMGYFTHLLDGTFDPRRGKRKSEETTN